MKKGVSILNLTVLILFFGFLVQKANSQVTADTTKIERLIEKNKTEEDELREKITALTKAKDRDSIERQIGIKLYKSQLLDRINKLKEQYLEGSNGFITIIDKTNDLNAFVTYGNARSSFLELVNPLNYNDFNNSLKSIQNGLKDNNKAPFWTAATDLISNLQNFVTNPSSIVPGLISAANKFSAKERCNFGSTV